MVIMEEISRAFSYAENINVYNGGVKVSYAAKEEPYNKILACWNEMIKGAHDMPAYGVSLNGYTVEKMKDGLWVEFCFGRVLKCNGMPFEKLLIEVNSGYNGFNLIRYTTQRGYDGRCFYLDLVGKTMDEFYNLLRNL